MLSCEHSLVLPSKFVSSKENILRTELRPQPESSPTGCLSVLKVGRSMVVITDNQGIQLTR